MKKKCIFPVALAAAMLVPLLTSAAGVLNRITYTASYNNNGLTIGTDTLGGVTYATVSYEDLYNGGEPGMPSLPIDYLKFSVPYNATNFTVTATTRWASQNLNYLVYPCQSPWMIGSPVPPIMLPDTSAYYSGNSYPSQMAWIVDEGFLAGENHIVTVAVMPFRYTHSINADVLSRAKNCYVTLRYDLSDSLAMSPIVRNDSLLREEGYQLTQSMVVNPGQVKSFAPADTFNPGIDSIGLIQGGIGGDELNVIPSDSTIFQWPDDPPQPGIIEPGTGEFPGVKYPYLIVTTQELKHVVRRLAALKRQKGYNVKVVTLDKVMTDTNAIHGDYVNGHIAYSDNAGKLRQYIRRHFQVYGTKFVLFVGTDVPYRTITHDLGGNTTKTFQSDMYYSDITADWSSGQFDKDPELYVGRILATSEEQINNYTDKLFRYELNPGRGDYSYVKNAFYSQSCEFKDYNTAGHPDEIDIIRCTLNSIYPTPCIIMEPDVNNTGIPYPSGEDIVNELNLTPYSFLSFHHHGCPSSLRTCGREGPDGIIPPMSFLWANNNELAYPFNWEKNDTLPEFGLNNIKNKYYPSICFSVSCITMPYEIPQYYKDKGLTMTFGESFTTGKDYGGPAFIGNTNDGLSPENAYLESKFVNRINDGLYRIGEANSYGKLDYNNLFKLTEKYVVAVQNLLGDPSIELWTDIPQVYDNIYVNRNDSAISVNGLNGRPTTITVNQLNGGGLSTRSVASDVTFNGVSPNSSITLYRHNYIPFILPLNLQKINIGLSQYVIASDVIAGNRIDNNRTNGDVVVKSGAEFEIEASGTVRLEDGFKVEKGATFAVYPSSF